MGGKAGSENPIVDSLDSDLSVDSVIHHSNNSWGEVCRCVCVANAHVCGTRACVALASSRVYVRHDPRTCDIKIKYKKESVSFHVYFPPAIVCCSYVFVCNLCVTVYVCMNLCCCPLSRGCPLNMGSA